MRRSAPLLAKLGVSALLLAYLLSTTDLDALLARVRGADVLLLAGAALLYSTMIALSIWRWHVLLRAQGFPAPLRPLSASYLVATFFNNFLPSNIGGDLIRVRDGSRLTGSRTTSLAIVAVDRILGLGALYALAATAFLTGGERVRSLVGAREVVVALGVVFAVLAYMFFRPGIARRLMALSGLERWSFARERFETVQNAVHVYRDQVGAVWLAFAASLLLQAVLVAYFFAVAHALSIALPFAACFLIVPLCLLVQAVPVSFNGWGVRESVFIVYFAQIGLSRESALAFSLLGAGLIVLLSLSGAVAWTTRTGMEAPAS